MIRRPVILGLSLLLTLTGSGYALAEEVSEYALKFALTYKFAKFTDWPTPFAGTCNLCAAGVSAYARDLAALDGKTVAGAVVKTRHVATPEEAASCHILFLRLDNANQLNHWLGGLKHQPILTVADSPAAWDRGAMIVLSLDADRIGFSIDAHRARAAGLTISSQVLALAKVVR